MNENLLGPQTGTLDTVAVGWTTLATLLIMGVTAPVEGGDIESAIKKKKKRINILKIENLRFLNK